MEGLFVAIALVFALVVGFKIANYLCCAWGYCEDDASVRVGKHRYCDEHAKTVRFRFGPEGIK